MKNLILAFIVFMLSLPAFAQKRTTTLSREETLNEKYCTSLFSTPGGVYFDLENDYGTESAISYLNILDWLQGRVAGLQVYSWRNLRIPFLRNQPAALFVDEMRVDANFLNVLSVHDIAMIKIIKSPFAGGWGAAGGAIAIYTKTGEEEEIE